MTPDARGAAGAQSVTPLGLAVVPGAGWRADDVERVAREAEDGGFDAILTTEVNNDALATAQLMGSVTRRIRVGTWIANVYLRHPYTCAQGAALVADLTGGRLVLGIGVSHRPVNDALGVSMSDPVADVRRYALDVQAWLRGDGPVTHLPQRPAPYPVPVHVAALTSRTVAQAAAIADGVMPTFWSPQRVREGRRWVQRGRAGRTGPFELSLGLPTFLGDDLPALHETARQNLALYTGFPFFQRMWRAGGFPAEAAAMERGVGAAALSDALLDSFCLIGPLGRCLERLAEYRDAGVDLPLLVPPIGPDGARAVVHAFAGAAVGV